MGWLLVGSALLCWILWRHRIARGLRKQMDAINRSFACYQVGRWYEFRNCWCHCTFEIMEVTYGRVNLLGHVVREPRCMVRPSRHSDPYCITYFSILSATELHGGCDYSPLMSGASVREMEEPFIR